MRIFARALFVAAAVAAIATGVLTAGPVNPPFLPTIASGAPTTAPTSQLYFDNSAAPYSGYVYDRALATWKAYGGAGSVTSVALALPAQFSISGSPVTGAGTLTGAWAVQTQNKLLASPNGGSGVPSFRAGVEADLSLSDNTTANVSAAAHGFSPKLSNDATTFLSGAGTWLSPPGTATFQPGYVSGRYYTTPLYTANATNSKSTGTLFITPFYVSRATTFTKVSILTGTVTGTVHATLCYYANSNGGQPTGAPIQNLGEELITSTTQNEITGLTIALSPGWYWFAVGIDGTAFIQSTAAAPAPGAFIMGQSSGPTAVPSGYTQSWTYSSNNCPTIGAISENTANGTSVVFLRL